MEDPESRVSHFQNRRFLYSFFSRVFLQAFVLTFLAEWGDRSQISTIILAARDVSGLPWHSGLLTESFFSSASQPVF